MRPAAPAPKSKGNRHLRPPSVPLSPPGPLRAALYVRVSTADGRQTTVNQRPVLQELADRRGWEVVRVYEDNESAWTGKSGDRPGFQAMLTDAEARRFDVVVFWSLDRFTREGAYPTLAYLNKLTGWGVAYFSSQEQYLDTAGPFKDAVVAILAAIAHQESIRLSERIKAGLKRAGATGKRIGKPPITPNLDYFRRANKVYKTDELMALFHCRRSSIYKYRQLVRMEDEALLAPSSPDPSSPAPGSTSSTSSPDSQDSPAA